VPQPIAELVEAARVVAPAQPPLLVEIGDVRHLRAQPPLYIGAATAGELQLAEVAGECHLPLVIEFLAAEHQDGIPVDCPGQRPHRRRIERSPGSDVADFRGKERVQLSYG